MGSEIGGHVVAASRNGGPNIVVVSPQLALLEKQFVREVQLRKSGDPLSPVAVIVGSNLQHIYLRRRLAEALGAVANVRFFTFLDLAGEIRLHQKSTDALLPLPDGAEVPLIKSLLDQEAITRPDSILTTGVAGFTEAMAASLRDLREGMIEPDLLVGSTLSAEKGDALASILHQFRARTRNLLDRTRLLEQAAGLPTEAIDQALAEGPILVYGIYDLNQLQLHLLFRVSQCRSIIAFVPWDRNDPSYQFVTPSINRLTAAGFDIRILATEESLPDREPQIQMFSTADRQAEIEEVVRRILSDIEDGVPPSEIALLHHLDQSYDELAAGVLERAGLPFYAASGRPVRRTAEGKAAMSLLRLLCAEPNRGQLLEFLSLPCTRLRWIDPELYSRPRQWEAISKDLGLVKGWEQFDSLLYFSLRNRSAEDSEDRPPYATEGTATLLRVVRALRNKASAAAMMTDWTSLSVWFVNLLERSVASGHDTRALDAIKDRVRLLAVLDQAGVPCNCTLFWEAADQAIRRTTVSGGYFQRDGLFLGGIKSARGLRFRRVYLAECAERVFPPIVRQDALLLDAEREALNQRTTSGFLSLRQLRLEEERLLFELLRQATRERLVVSYSRRASLSGTPRLPSSLMLDAASRVSGTFQSIEEIERAGYDWFLRLPSRIGFDGHDAADALRALDRSDLRLHVLERAGNQGADVVAPFWPQLARARRLWRDRRGRSFGPFDGVVPPGMVEQCGILSENLSATSLARYSVCPYRFFLSRVLKLTARREPEETLEISPADVGSFAHRLLECFVTRFLQQGGDWEEYLQSAEETLAEIIEEELPTIAPGVTGLPVSWHIIRGQLEADLRAYLAEERTKVAEGWRPVAAEWRFKDVAVSAGAWTLKIRGAIDRIDRKADALRVIDYKTGQVRDRVDGYRTGECLQLPLYLKAACYQEGVAQEISRAELHFLTRRGNYARLALSGDDLSGGRLEDVLSNMAEGISQGSFFYWAGPGRSNCRLCDFNEVCDTRVEQLANRKAPGSRAVMEPWRRIHDDG